ncbi:protein SHORT ROOT IN SALT MEDIUM 1-like isoform X3 [Populus nigra]|uniref:protein SHORT ROOT IN SALT MEDIUM 1-like isoform X3 n=1 Tax=Populus nigra TaxID=3691 RepID=UPI002B26CDC4|nr:protein SHORT ROOT IN SALT MEDIUM 1-like isoform X3 [Populus nigra]
MFLFIGLNNMYSPRGSNAYGAQSAYAQYLGMTYSGSSVGGLDGGSQHSLAYRHSSILGGPQEADVGGYRDYASATSHYEDQYRAVYGSTSMSGAQQLCSLSLSLDALLDYTALTVC